LTTIGSGVIASLTAMIVAPSPVAEASRALRLPDRQEEGGRSFRTADWRRHVPLASALGRHANPALSLKFDEARVWVADGTNHLDLLSRRAVYARIKDWLVASD
jgi:hypothetical protein